MARQSLTPIVLPGDPVAPLEAAPKQYVDAAIAAIPAGDEVSIGPDDPGTTGFELWFDTDEVAPPSGGGGGGGVSADAGNEAVLGTDDLVLVPRNVFPDAASRAAAIPAPVNGMRSFLAPSSVTGQDNGPEYWNGTSWRKPWNLPWGLMGFKDVIVDQFGVAENAWTAMTNFQVTNITFVNRRRYEFRWKARFNLSTAGPGTIDIRLLVEGVPALQAPIIFNENYIEANKTITPYGTYLYPTFLDGPKGVSLEVKHIGGSGGLLNIMNSGTSGQFSVHDIGPASGQAPA